MPRARSGDLLETFCYFLEVLIVGQTCRTLPSRESVVLGTPSLPSDSRLGPLGLGFELCTCATEAAALRVRCSHPVFQEKPRTNVRPLTFGSRGELIPQEAAWLGFGQRDSFPPVCPVDVLSKVAVCPGALMPMISAPPRAPRASPGTLGILHSQVKLNHFLFKKAFIEM